MTPVKTLTVGLLLGCLAVGTYAALEDNVPAEIVPAAGGPIAAVPEGPNSAPSPHGAAPPSAGEEIGGQVLEVIQVPSYTYLRLDRGSDGETWTAVSKAEVVKGQTVQLERAERMEDFSSKQLGRTFPVIYFGTLVAEGSTSASANPHGAASNSASPHGATAGQRGGRGEVADMVKIIPGERAEGDNGHRIADLFALKEKLAGSKIRVRGTVVQVTMNVMETNFVHIRDGSGSDKEKTHDLVLKVAENPPIVGNQALFEGTLKANVDLGAGYTYSALIENASIVE